MMRQRAVERKNEEMEVMEVEEEGKSGEESESESEYEEYTDSEDEAEPRLKPVFIRKYELTAALRHNYSAAVFNDAEARPTPQTGRSDVSDRDKTICCIYSFILFSFSCL